MAVDISLIHPLAQLFHFAGQCGTSTGFLPGLYDGLCNGNNVEIKSIQDVFIVVANITRIMIAASGGVAVIFILVGAIYYIVSAGDPGRLKQAKDILTNSVVGLVIILVAYSVVTFITSKF